MSAMTFNLIVILIAAPIWFLVILARSDKEKQTEFHVHFLATAMITGLTLSVAWGIRLICLHVL